MALLLAAIAVLVSACGKKVDSQSPSIDFTSLGPEIYEQSCMLCHLNGEGNEINPPLIGSQVVAARDETELLSVILHGQSGKREVAGKWYDGVMPAQSSLTDEEVAAVATYVRKQFGRQERPVSLQRVKEIRAQKPMGN